MAGAISRYLEEDHTRIDNALRRAVSLGEAIEPTPYAEFRGALLRHIGMEEKILLPAAREAGGGKPLPQAAQLHLDHGALAALLVPTPTKAIVAAIQAILQRHNAIEEGPGGVYEECEQLPGLDAGAVLARLKSAPAVAMAPHADSPIAFESMRAALERAGYSFEL
jgi:hemerythrin HHE cation binding domain-containing protein